jgi:hypothetical protein
MQRPTAKLFISFLCFAIPTIIFIAIWAPSILHYYVPNVVITKEIAERARTDPPDTILNEINRFFDTSAFTDEKELIAAAEKVLQGKIEIPGRSPAVFGFPFDSDDFDRNLPGWKLFFSRLSIPALLMQAYEITGRNDFLAAAKDVILGFAIYERRAWIPKGLLWNDHAIAARISVIAKFWKLYRNHTEYEFKVAEEILQLVARSAQLLAKPTHFTFNTNHGIMQNLALWQICIAFPSLPDVDFYKQLALERMQDQIKFYVSNEGVVLEHSAGYHRVGLKFIAMAFRYMRLLNEPIPDEWEIKYQKARIFNTQLQRPDGSLPMFGDTASLGEKTRKNIKGKVANGQSKSMIYKKGRSIKQHSLYPIAGYAIWWNGLDELSNEQILSQTVLAWSYFPGHAHKHADEMSVLLWAAGHNWITNIGYWPYGMKYRSKAVSWAGSNAPHLINEPFNSKRQTELLSNIWSDSSAFIELERQGPDGYIARRQVLNIKPNIWIVLDNTIGNENQRTKTIWTSSYHFNPVMAEFPNSYIFKANNNDVYLTKFIITSKNAEISQYKGSVSPFAGWESYRPAPAIVIEQPAKNSWAAAIWLLQGFKGQNRRFSNPPVMENWKNSENWKIRLPFSSGLMIICREKNRIFFQKDNTGGGAQKKYILSEAQQISIERAEIKKAYQNAAKKYQRKIYKKYRHKKATYLLLAIFVIQGIIFLICRKFGKMHYTRLVIMTIFGWASLGILLFGIYL